MATARIMAPSEFGAFGALLGVSIIGSTLATGAQALVARRVAAAPAGDAEAAANGALRVCAGAAVMLMAISVITAPLAAALLSTSWLAFLTTMISVAVLVPAFGVLGVAQGRRHDERFGWAYAAVGLWRAVGAVAIVVLLPTATGAGAGLVLGALIGTTHAARIAGVDLLAVLRGAPSMSSTGPRRSAQPGEMHRSMRHELWRNVSSLLGLYVLMNLDMVLARAFLTTHESAQYAVGALVAKIAFFLPGFITAVLFARMAVTGGHRARLVSVAATVVFGVIATAVTYLFSRWILLIVAGQGYVGLAPHLWLFAAQGGLYAVIQALLYVRLAAEDRGTALLVWLALVVFAVTVIGWRHAGVMDVVGTSVTIAASLALVSALSEARGSGRASHTKE